MTGRKVAVFPYAIPSRCMWFPWQLIIICLFSVGVVRLIMPDKMPVPYGDTNKNITCIATEDLGTTPQWSITNINGQYDITNGTVSTVTTLSKTESQIQLNEVTELWKGMFVCMYVRLLYN